MSATVTTEMFARDMWEALRAELREKLGGAVSQVDFEARFPAWQDMDWEKRQARVQLVRDDVLKVMDRAGYQVHRVRTAP